MFRARYADVTMRANPADPAPRLAGLVLAAGAGSRFGGPKGLAREPDGRPWATIAARMLIAVGCRDVLVAVGAQADEVSALIPSGARAVPVADWAEGVAASLRAGLADAAATDATALLIVPVDTPAMPLAALERVRDAGGGDAALVQAVYAGRAGHPVLIGRAHWAAVAASVSGDRGARPYLARHGVREIECGDLWTGADIDRRPVR